MARGEHKDGIEHLEKHKFIYKRIHKTDGVEPTSQIHRANGYVLIVMN